MIDKFDCKFYFDKESKALDDIIYNLCKEWDIMLEPYTKVEITLPKSKKPEPKLHIPFNGIEINDIIINDPAVIVRFSDGTKTVAKVAGSDKFNAETGLYVCLLKKLMGKQFRKVAEACWEVM